MITRIDNLNSVVKTEKISGINKKSENLNETRSLSSASLRYADDDVSISDNANIDLSFFNYIDKGGDATAALQEGKSEDKPFMAKPNFAGIGVSRYNLMKAEIEKNYAADPETKSKYLKELDKALEDYLQLHEKITAASSEKEELSDDYEVDQNEAAITEESLKKMFWGGSKEAMVILDKVLGKSENNYQDELLSKTVDDYFVNIYRNNMDIDRQKDVFGRDVKEEEMTRKKWEAVKLHIHSD